MSHEETSPALAARVARLAATMDAAVKSSRRRNAFTLCLWGAAVVGMAGYLFFAHRQFRQVDPDMALGMGSHVVKDRLPAVFAHVRAQGRTMAPVLAAEGEKSLLALPDQLHATLTRQLEKQLTLHSPALEQAMYDRFKETLDREAAVRAGDTRSPEQRYADIITRMHEDTRQHVSETYARFLAESNDVLNYLDHLANGADLTERQRLQRDLLRSMMILWREHEAQSAARAAARAGL